MPCQPSFSLISMFLWCLKQQLLWLPFTKTIPSCFPSCSKANINWPNTSIGELQHWYYLKWTYCQFWGNWPHYKIHKIIHILIQIDLNFLSAIFHNIRSTFIAHLSYFLCIGLPVGLGVLNQFLFLYSSCLLLVCKNGFNACTWILSHEI